MNGGRRPFGFDDFRPGERLLNNEHSYAGTNVRGDMRTLDSSNLIRIWEFEINASYEGLGQVLTYVAMARLESNFARQIRGVLAAFKFQPEITMAIEALNLGMEQVILPHTLSRAGAIPSIGPEHVMPEIPRIPSLEFVQPTAQETE